MEEILNYEAILYVIKTFFITIYGYNISFKIINQENIKIWKKVKLILINILLGILCYYIKVITNSFNSIIFQLIYTTIVFANITKKEMGESIVINLVSFAINYILFFIAVVLSFFITKMLNVQKYCIDLVVILLIYTILIIIFGNIKRIKKGFLFLQIKLKNEFLNTLIINISSTILIGYIMLSNYEETLTNNLIWGIFILIIIMFITIQKSIQLYYKQKLLIQDLEETKKELEEKKEEIKKLEQENLSFSKKSHSIAHKQKALEHKLNEILLLKTELGSETNIKEKIDKISEEISKNKPQVELSKTNIEEIDDMLKYMQSECIKNNIDFDLQIIGNIYQMTNNYISKEKLEILLADHVKNAIIAINYSDNINKSILVRLGKIDGFYSLYIYDSGIEFEINTLLNLGVKPSTTHKSSGGTGMGFMNTFDTVREYKASFILEEYGKPSKDDYTKAIMIKFDKKEDFKIISYRKEEIENEAKGKKLNFILNKRNNI